MKILQVIIGNKLHQYDKLAFFVSNPKVFADRKTGRFNSSASIMEQKEDRLKRPMNRV